MPPSVDDQIAALKNRLTKLEAKAKSEKRKKDTRRKIIVGGAILARMEKDAGFGQLVRSILAASVGRQIDREAIADLLAEKPSTPAAAAQPSPNAFVMVDGGGSGVSGG